MTLRLGLLSTARINRLLLGSGARGVEFAAVASRDGALAQAYAHEHGIPRSHGSYEALLADEGVDAVYVSLPNRLHHEWTMRALEAGKHVLCEKPYSRRPADVEEAFALAADRGLVLMEAFMYRHHPQTARIVELARSGALGAVRLVRGSFSFRLDDAANIRLDPELDGGSLMDVGSYCVSGARLVAGAEPVSVLGGAVAAPGGVDLAFHGVLGFPGDLVAMIDSSFALPSRQRLEVHGEEASLVAEAPWRVDAGGRLLLVRDGAVEELDVPAADAYALELENLAAAVAGTAGPLLGRADALGQARTLDALYRAASAHEAIAL